MSLALTVCRRELRSFFDSPMAYVVAIAFLVINCGLFVLDFWVADQVSMRSFFDWVSWSACFFIPAITMRAWAEERRGATFELLLTLPSRARSLVMGKFLAAFLFYTSCLAGSVVLPVCLKLLSTPGLAPDWGTIAAGYVGALLTGALLIALGLFLSMLCRDQVEAYIVTLAIIVLLRLTGFVPVAAQLDSIVGGTGTFLREAVSFATPLSRATRGILALGDILFFAVWTIGLLALNAVLVDESRLGPGSRARRLAAIALGLPAIVLLGSLALETPTRLDLTADKLFTVSPAARSVLLQVPADDPIRVSLYFSPKNEMPAFMANLERDTVEKLEGLERASEGRLVVETFHLHADDAILRAAQEAQSEILGKEDAAKSGEGRGAVEEKLLREGVVPFRVRSGGLTGSETKVVYAALALTHGAAKKEVIQQITPGLLAGMEQEIVTRAWRLAHDEKPVVGLLAPIQSMNIDPQQLQLLAQLGMPVDQMAREQDDYRLVAALIGQDEQYEVRRLRPDSTQPLPADIKTLVLIRPEGMTERMRWELARFLARGGTLIVAVQAYDWALASGQGYVYPQFRAVDTGLGDLLTQNGVDVPTKVVMNDPFFPVTYGVGQSGSQVTVDFRWIFRLDAANFDHGTAIANNLGGFVFVESASPITLDDAKLKERGLSATRIMMTGPKAWTRDVPPVDVPADFNNDQAGEGPLTLAALVRGIFPPPTGAAPAWPGAPEGSVEPEAEPIVPKAGNLVVIGTSRPFLDDAVADSSGAVAWSGVLLKNSVDALSLSEELLGLTSRDPIERPIRDVERGTVLMYEVVMVALAPALILVLGIAWLVARRRRQERRHAPAATSPSVSA